MCWTPKIKTQASPSPPQPEDINAAGLRERQKRAGALSFGSTILGGSLGSSDTATTAPKSLLGQ